MLLCGLSLLSISLVPPGHPHIVMAIALFGKMCITFSFGVIFLFITELLPTEIRTTGLGTASFIGRWGILILLVLCFSFYSYSFYHFLSPTSALLLNLPQVWRYVSSLGGNLGKGPGHALPYCHGGLCFYCPVRSFRLCSCV